MTHKDFPALEKISYLDNAATTQKPLQVLDAIRDFYLHKNANPHRGIYALANEATESVENAIENIAKHIGCRADQLIFSSGVTDLLNKLSHMHKGNIVTSEIEHHSNLVPWQKRAKNLKVVKLEEIYQIEKYVDEKTELVTLTHMSNVSGEIFDLKKIIANVKEKNPNCKVAIDGCQSTPHIKLNLNELGCDYYAFSAHKMYGPTGIGALFVKDTYALEPFNYGGGMVNEVTTTKTTISEAPRKHQGGTQNAAGIVGMSAAFDYLHENFEEKIMQEEQLTKYCLQELRKIPSINIIGHEKGKKYGPVISFTVEGVHSHDVAQTVDEFNTCIRAGHHCAEPYMKKLGVDSTSRASISFYNTKTDIDNLILGVKKSIEDFQNG